MLHFQEILSAIDNNYDYISVAVLLHLLILLFFIVIRIFIIIFCNDPVKLKLLQVCKSCFQGAGAVGVIAGFMHITSTTPHLLTPIKHPWVYSYQKQIQGWSYRSVSEGLCGLEFERLHPGVKVLVDEEGFIDPAQCRISNNNVLKQTYNSAVPRFVPKFVPEPLHPPVEKK